ncbi:MAG: dienelactone hydrolase family protein [Nitrospirota bacterium]
MVERVAPFTKEQIGTGTVRFPSGEPIPSISDLSVDPYFKTRQSKAAQVEGLMFWPQAKGTYPALIVLHEAWGLNVQIKDLAARLACEGYVTLVPNLYARQGGMVTANAEVAAALMERVKEADMMQDLNACCEFLNTRDYVKRNIHGAIGFGMGGWLAMRFACYRRRLRTSVSFYGRLITPLSLLKDQACPIQYHRAALDQGVTAEQVEELTRVAREYGKRIDVRTYEGSPLGFCNEMRPDTYRSDAANRAWEATVEFLSECFKDAK